MSTAIHSVQLVVGMEVHVELATRTKMFSSAPNPAHPESDTSPPNSLIDPTVLALPGSLPVMNHAAVEMAMMVGLALNCQIAEQTKWDRKSYFYPDLPKGYQISQYDLPLCFDGSFQLPGVDAAGRADPDAPTRNIGILRAHLEEDAGKLLHEAPGGHHLDCSIVDWNRAGTPLLEIVTQPDFRSADEVVLFARMLRNICRFLGVTEGIMQKGHIRFEPNINTLITFSDGTLVKTPIVEIKNLNSFKAVKGAIEYELSEQPRRYLADRRVLGKGMKRTMGWDDSAGVTVPQREKEDADDYRYFPDPDLVPVVIDKGWRSRVAARIPELPAARVARYVEQFSLTTKDAAALLEERDTCFFFESAVETLVTLGVERSRAGKRTANFVLQSGAKRANERALQVNELGISPAQLAHVAKLREDGALNSNTADELFGLLCEPQHRNADAAVLATALGMLVARDDAEWEAWCDRAIAANPKVAADVRSGKQAAVGRLVGEAMKLSVGRADAKVLREMLLKKLGA